MSFLSTLFKETLQDNVTGKYSHAKIIAMLGAIGATIFMWKLIILGGMTIEYFVAYLTWCTSHQTLNKYLDIRKGTISQNDDKTRTQ